MPPDPSEAPPYYAVIFTSRRTPIEEGYEDTAARMLELAGSREGFLGVDSLREGEQGVTVSYWRDLAAIREWKADVEHLDAQRAGRDRWYQSFRVRICRVEREYGFEKIAGL